MGTSPDSQNSFPLRDLTQPLQRAQQVVARHGLYEADSNAPDGGEGAGSTSHFSWRRLRDAAWGVAQSAIDPVSSVIADRAHWAHIRQALSQSTHEAGELIVSQTKGSLRGIVAGFLPSLLDIAKWVGGGAVLGGAIGAVGGPADEITVPGGALAGAELGLWIANSLGLAQLLWAVAKNLGKFAELAKDATYVSWYAGEDPHYPEVSDISTAASLYAAAIAELWIVLLQAMVAEVMKRAGGYLGKKIAKNEAIQLAIGDVSETLRKSKLGQPVAEWFKNNFEQIRKTVEERKKALDKEAGDRGKGEEGGTAAEAAKAEATVVGRTEQAAPTQPPPLPPEEASGGTGATDAKGVISDKIRRQMPRRGWDEAGVQDTLSNPYTTRTALNKATGFAATAYFNKDGSYLVRDNATEEIIQISKKGDPDWVPDDSIIDPYRP